MDVPKRTTTPIRFSEGQDAAVKRIAEACGVKEAEIVRWAVEALSDYWQHHGGRLLLPLRFHETFSVITLDPQKPLILREPPHAVRESVRSAGSSKIEKRGRQSGVRA